eukprot:m51a1_g6687 hypothetical protein (1010) ;mRNA; f:35863-39657
MPAGRSQWVDSEIRKLIAVIAGTGSRTITFRALFDRTVDDFEAISGTLVAARKRGVVEYEGGGLLLSGTHDDVVIRLLKDTIPDSALPARETEAPKPRGGAGGKTRGFENIDLSNNKCGNCGKTVYATERVDAAGMAFHRGCFVCSQCKCTLRTTEFCMINKTIYCKPHYMQIYQAKGGYDGFEGSSRRAGKTPSPTPAPAPAQAQQQQPREPPVAMAQVLAGSTPAARQTPSPSQQQQEDETRRAAAESRARQEEAQRMAREADERRQREAAEADARARQAEDTRRQREMAEAEESRRRRAEEERLAAEARAREQQEARRRADEERAAAAREAEARRLQAEEARKQRELLEAKASGVNGGDVLIAMQRAEEERLAFEARMREAENKKRQLEEARRQKEALEAARKAEEERLAIEARIREAEKKRQAEEERRQREALEAAKRAEAERMALEARIREAELRRQAEEERRQREAAEAAKRAEEERLALEARIREAEKKRQEEDDHRRWEALERSKKAEAERLAMEATIREADKRRQAEEDRRQREAYEAAEARRQREAADEWRRRKAADAARLRDQEEARKAEEERQRNRAFVEAETRRQAEEEQRVRAAAQEARAREAERQKRVSDASNAQADTFRRAATSARFGGSSAVPAVSSPSSSQQRLLKAQEDARRQLAMLETSAKSLDGGLASRRRQQQQDHLEALRSGAEEARKMAQTEWQSTQANAAGAERGPLPTCRGCHKALWAENARFCTYCGLKVVQAFPAPPRAPAPAPPAPAPAAGSPVSRSAIVFKPAVARSRNSLPPVGKNWEVVNNLIEYLMENGTYETDIWRRSLFPDEVRDLWEEIQSGNNASDLSGYSCNTAASCLKRVLFTREPMIPYEHYDTLVAVRTMSRGGQGILLCIQEVVPKIPLANAVVLYKLLALLGQVAAHSSVTGNTAEALGYTLGPAIMRPRGLMEDLAKFAAGTGERSHLELAVKFANELLTMMIEDIDIVFEAVGPISEYHSRHSS